MTSASNRYRCSVTCSCEKVDVKLSHDFRAAPCLYQRTHPCNCRTRPLEVVSHDCAIGCLVHLYIQVDIDPLLLAVQATWPDQVLGCFEGLIHYLRTEVLMFGTQ
jgi:hypothetical protein